MQKPAWILFLFVTGCVLCPGRPGMNRAAAMEAQPGALRAAIEDLMGKFPHDYPRAEVFLDRLDALEVETTDGEVTPDARARFERLRFEALTANPLVSGRPILFVARRQYKPDHHNTETMFQTGEINTMSFEGGGALRVLDISRGGETHTLLEAPNGIIRDPDVHFDGDRILFSMRRNIEDDYSLYEINSDGTGMRALTATAGVSDIDPLYLPCGDIVFSSSREPKYCMCNRHIMCNLFRMDGDGANIHQIGKSTLFEGHGALMPDGRILYYRWEYVDRNFGDAQGLWTVYPDGTNHALYWGNNTQSPGAVIDGRPIPGTQQVVCIFSSCHDRPWGALAIIDRRLGMDGAADGSRSPSVVRIWPAEAIEMVGENDWDRYNWDTFMAVTPKYEDPYPLDDTYFLCARTIGAGEVTGIFLIDLFGNEILLHAEGDTEDAPGCFNPMPLAPRPRPPVLPVRRDYNNDVGYFFLADVYQGPYMEGVERGTIKYLRVIESPEKRSFTHPFWDGQGQQAPAMSWHDFNNKRILGTVPVAADGSAWFSVPSDRFVYFQALDGQGLMVQSMRSGTMVQSGETQGCIGCHENRRTAAPLANAPALDALRKPPDSLTGWYGPPRFFCYMREVQPVFDAHCVRCHDYDAEAGQLLNLARDRDLVFNTSFNELWRKQYIAAIGAGPAQVQPAYSWGARASALMQSVLEPHQDIVLDEESIARITTWIDINAPYYPEYDSAYPENLAGRSPLDNRQLRRLAQLTGTDFAAKMTYHSNTGPLISFDRPEQSPCLQGLEEKDPDAWREALNIIRAGAKMLEARPRADMDGFIACDAHLQVQKRYQTRLAVELRNRAALRDGEAVYDFE